MSNPLEDFAEEYLPVREKSAAFGGLLTQAARMPEAIGSGVLQGIGAVGATAIIGGIGMAAHKVYGAATKSRDFHNMLSFNPDLREHQARDPRKFNQMYTSLRSMNSTFGKDPLVSGTYMRRMVENPLTAGGILTESIGDKDKHRSPMGSAFEAGTSVASKQYLEHLKPPKPSKPPKP